MSKILTKQEKEIKNDIIKGVGEDVKALKNKVLYMLKNRPKTRNSDLILTLQLWHHYYPDSFITDPKTGKKFVSCDHIFQILPSNDAIKRCRAIITNDEKLYPPTIWSVAKQRGFKESAWRTALGYDIEGNKTLFS